jgi:hypothetical protein
VAVSTKAIWGPCLICFVNVVVLYGMETRSLHFDAIIEAFLAADRELETLLYSARVL